MAKKKTSDLIKQVFESISREPKSINEVAGDINTNWESARRALIFLKSLGLVVESEEGNKRFFRLSRSTGLVLNPETLRGLPLSRERENLINFLFMRIRDVWRGKTGVFPNKTQVQKTLVKVVEDCGLDVPIGWYKFGMMCVKHYDPEVNYLFRTPDAVESIESHIHAAVDYYKGYKSVVELKRRQYLDKGNNLYILREKIQDRLCFRFDEKGKSVLRHLFTEFAFSFPLRENNRGIVTILNDFVSAVISIVKDSDEKELNLCRMDIVEGFDSLWGLLATYMLFDSLSGFYPPEQLHDYFRDDIESKKESVREHTSYLGVYVKPAGEEDFEDKRFLEDFQGIIPLREELTQEDRKKLAEEFERGGSDVFGEYDLD